MGDVSDDAVPPPGEPSFASAGDSGIAVAPVRRVGPKVSRVLTWMLTAGLCAGAAGLVWDSPDPRRLLAYPGYVAVRTYDSHLDVLAAAEERQPWLARIFAFFGSRLTDVRQEAIDELTALLEFWVLTDPTVETSPGGDDERDHVRAHLAILLLETERPDAAREALRLFDTERRRDFLRMMSTAYPELRLDLGAAASAEPNDEARTILDWGWCARRVAHRLTSAGVDPVAFGFPSDPATLAYVPQLASVAAETIVWIVVLACGVVALVVVLRRGRSWSRIGDAVTVAPWTGSATWAVIVRGAALFVVVGLGLQLAWERFGSGGWAPGGVGPALIPFMLLAGWDLLRPHCLSWSRAIGIPARSGTEIRLVVLVAAALAADVLGAGIIGWLAHAAGVHVPWSEGVMEGLITGGVANRMLFAIDAVLLAPILEETVMRGIVYPALRRSWSPAVAAIVSGAAFSLVHGYGLAGSLALFWGGVVLAMAYERTGTLLVPILVHAVYNLAVVLAHGHLV